MTRDETAWTWWTLPPAIAGRLAQRSHMRIPLCSHWRPATKRGEISLLLEFNDGVAGRCRPCGAYFINARCAGAVNLFRQPARVTADLDQVAVRIAEISQLTEVTLYQLGMTRPAGWPCWRGRASPFMA